VPVLTGLTRAIAILSHAGVSALTRRLSASAVHSSMRVRNLDFLDVLNDEAEWFTLQLLTTLAPMKNCGIRFHSTAYLQELV
jgi:hypothetical protein